MEFTSEPKPHQTKSWNDTSNFESIRLAKSSV